MITLFFCFFWGGGGKSIFEGWGEGYICFRPKYRPLLRSVLWIRGILVRIRIHTNLQNQIWIQTLLVSSVADKMPAKNKFKKKTFFDCYFLKVPVHLPSVFIDKKWKRSHKIVEIKVFSLFFACWWKDPDLDPVPYPEGQKTSCSYRSGSTTLATYLPFYAQTVKYENLMFLDTKGIKPISSFLLKIHLYV